MITDNARGSTAREINARLMEGRKVAEELRKRFDDIHNHALCSYLVRVMWWRERLRREAVRGQFLLECSEECWVGCMGAEFAALQDPRS